MNKSKSKSVAPINKQDPAHTCWYRFNLGETFIKLTFCEANLISILVFFELHNVKYCLQAPLEVCTNKAGADALTARGFLLEEIGNPLDARGDPLKVATSSHASYPLEAWKAAFFDRDESTRMFFTQFVLCMDFNPVNEPLEKAIRLTPEVLKQVTVFAVIYNQRVQVMSGLDAHLPVFLYPVLANQDDLDHNMAQFIRFFIPAFTAFTQLKKNTGDATIFNWNYLIKPY
jgi:hypothetical protein